MLRSESWRLVIEPPKGTSPRARLWVEHRRAELAWLPAPVRHWWSRWMRQSKKYRMALSDNFQGRAGYTPPKTVSGWVQRKAHERIIGNRHTIDQRRGWVGFQDRQGRRYVPLTQEEVHQVLRRIDEVK